MQSWEDPPSSLSMGWFEASKLVLQLRVIVIVIVIVFFVVFVSRFAALGCFQNDFEGD